MALLEFCQNIIRNCLVMSGTIFDSQAVDYLKLNLTLFNFVLEQEFNNSLRFLCDDRTDTVTATNTDNDFVK